MRIKQLAALPMITFEPLELEATLRSAIRRLGSSFYIDLDGYPLPPDFELDLDDDWLISSDTELTLDFPRTEDGVSLPVKDLIDLSLEVTDSATSFDGLTYHSSRRTIIRMNSTDLRSHAFADRVSASHRHELKMISEVGGKPSNISIKNDSAHFGAIIVARDHFYDKYNPPLTGDELFIEVEHPHGASITDCNALIHAYLFELHTTLGLEFFEWPRPLDDEIDYPEDEDIGELVGQAGRLRPLLIGQGLLSVLSEFNSAHGANRSDWSLLSYVKCIEYVAATVVREKQYEDLRKRLLTRDALKPNAEFMDGLLLLFEENRTLTKDAEAIRLSIERCCDPIPMAGHAPAFLRTLAKIGPSSTLAQRQASLLDLSAALTATRNQLAHAKANYRRTGKECPPEQLSSLVVCARIAAEQCIRWYSSRPEDLRRG